MTPRSMQGPRQARDVYHPDVTIYEGGGINNGWIDYRDRHLGPELKSFEDLQFGHSNTRVTVLPGGQPHMRRPALDQGQDGRTSA